MNCLQQVVLPMYIDQNVKGSQHPGFFTSQFTSSRRARAYRDLRPGPLERPFRRAETSAPSPLLKEVDDFLRAILVSGSTCFLRQKITFSPWKPRRTPKSCFLRATDNSSESTVWRIRRDCQCRKYVRLFLAKVFKE